MADPYGNLSPEEYSQQQQINRQQKMAEMLMGQNQQPQGQMVSGRYVAPSFFQNLQPIANMLTGAYLAKQGDTKAQELAQAIRTRDDEAMKNLINVSKGTPAQQVPQAGPPSEAMLKENQFNLPNRTIPGVPASQEDILLAAMKLRDPSVKNMMLAERFKPKAPLTVAQGAAVITQNPDGTFTKTFENPKALELSTDIKTALALNPNLPRNPDNWTKQDALQAQQTIALHKKMSAPQSTTYVDARSATSLAGPIGEMLKGSKEATVGAYNNLTSANAILANVDKAITGSAANQRIGLSQLASTLGLGNAKNPESLAATRTLIQNMAKLQIGTHVKGEGAVSDFERRLKAAAEGGNIDFTPIEIKQNIENQLKTLENSKKVDMPWLANTFTI